MERVKKNCRSKTTDQSPDQRCFSQGDPVGGGGVLTNNSQIIVYTAGYSLCNIQRNPTAEPYLPDVLWGFIQYRYQVDRLSRFALTPFDSW